MNNCLNFGLYTLVISIAVFASGTQKTERPGRRDDGRAFFFILHFAKSDLPDYSDLADYSDYSDCSDYSDYSACSAYSDDSEG